MQNPFRPGNGIEPPYLAGRLGTLQRFGESLDEFEHGLPRNLLIFGLRGTGKTVVMKHFVPIAESRGWITVSRELNKRFCEETNFAEAIASDVVAKVSEVSLAKKLQKYGKRLLEQAKPAEISAHGISYKPFYKEEKELLDDYLKNTLVNNWKAIQGSGAKGLVFLYDEFHSVRDGEIPGNYPLASVLGALSHAQREGCRYCLVVSGLPNLPANMKDAKTYTERMFTFEELSNLAGDEAEEAIRVPMERSGYSFEEGLVNEIVRETKGYPYFVQFYCYFLIRNSPRSKVTLADYGRLKDKMLRELDLSFYEDRLNKATPLEQEILEAMAKTGMDEASPSEILKALKIEKSALFAYLRSLAEKNLIYKSGRGKYAFTVPMFREFLLRRGHKR